MNSNVKLKGNYESKMREHVQALDKEHSDPSHDILHIERVVKLSRKMCEALHASEEVVVPAAYLHDCVYISKSDARRKQASRISADKAIELLTLWEYPEEFYPPIHHAIVAHSFSAKIPAESLEAKIVQDADRLDALGAIGVVRCFTLGALMNRPLYSKDDPFCEERLPNDQVNTLDHFYVKLLGLVDSLHTDWAKEEGLKRLQVLKTFLHDLKREIS